MKKLFVIAVEEMIYCPVTYVRLISHLRAVPGDMDFRVYEVRQNLDEALAALEYASGLILARSVSLQSFYLVKAARKLGLPIVYDIDDYLWLLPDYLGSGKAGGVIDEIISLCDVLTTPQIKLKDYILKKHPHLRVHVIPNAGNILVSDTPPAYVTGILANSDVFRLPKIKADFFKALRDAAHDIGKVLILYYFSNDVPEHHTDDQYLKVIWGGIRSFSSYKELLTILKPDFGFVPLAGDHFSQYKSVIKFAELSAVGSVGIYSRVEPYISFVRENVDGFFAENSYLGWYEATKKALSSNQTEYKIVQQNAMSRAKCDFDKTAIASQFYKVLQSLPARQVQYTFLSTGWRPPGEEKFLWAEAYSNVTDRLKVFEWLNWSVTNRVFLVKKFFSSFSSIRRIKRLIGSFLQIFR